MVVPTKWKINTPGGGGSCGLVSRKLPMFLSSPPPAQLQNQKGPSIWTFANFEGGPQNCAKVPEWPRILEGNYITRVPPIWIWHTFGDGGGWGRPAPRPCFCSRIVILWPWRRPGLCSCFRFQHFPKSRQNLVLWTSCLAEILSRLVSIFLVFSVFWHFLFFFFCCCVFPLFFPCFSCFFVCWKMMFLVSSSFPLTSISCL